MREKEIAEIAAIMLLFIRYLLLLPLNVCVCFGVCCTLVLWCGSLCPHLRKRGLITLLKLC